MKQKAEFPAFNNLPLISDASCANTRLHFLDTSRVSIQNVLTPSKI